MRLNISRRNLCHILAVTTKLLRIRDLSAFSSDANQGMHLGLDFIFHFLPYERRKTNFGALLSPTKLRKNPISAMLAYDRALNFRIVFQCKAYGFKNFLPAT